MAEAAITEEVPGERGHAGLALADHWIIYIIVLTFAVFLTANLFYYLFIRLGWTGAASFFR